MKQWRQQFDQLAHDNREKSIEIVSLSRKVNRLQSQLDALSSFINRRKS